MVKSVESKYIVDALVDSFTSVEIQDRKVDEIFLPRSKFYRLMLGYPFINPVGQFRGFSGAQQGLVNNPLLMRRLEQTAHYRSKVGELWGASVFLTDDSKGEVVSRVFDHKYGNEIIRVPVEFLSDLMVKLKENLVVIVKARSKPLPNINDDEARAIETLREMLTETEYRRYIKNQFILVKGSSGNTYQVFRDKSHTNVWCNGKKVEEVCVRIKDSRIPPTDNVIAFKTIIETNEEEFKKMGNVYKICNG